MNNVCLYLRVSTSSQSTDAQEKDLLEFCQRSNYNIVHIYKDVSSGAKVSRPELDKLMSDARRLYFRKVIVWRFDRFARSTKHLTLALEEFQNLGIDFISYQENIRTDSPMGKAMFTIISAMSQLERDVIRERVKSGLANAKAKGKTLGRPKTRNDELIHQLRSKGLSYRAIAKELDTSVGAVQRSLKVTINTCLKS